MKRKSAIIGFSYLFGLICASFSDNLWAVIIGSALIIIAITLEFFRKKGLALASFILGAGFCTMALYNFMIIGTADSLVGEKREVVAIVKVKGNPSNDMASYELEINVLGRPLRILMYGEDREVQSGDRLEFVALFTGFEDNAEFPTEMYYFGQGIQLGATADSEIIVHRSDSYVLANYINSFNGYIKTKVNEKMPNDFGALINAIFLGDKSELTPESKLDIQRIGISHLTAVSGFHLTTIVHFVMLFLNLTPLKVKRKAKFVVMMVMIAVFIIFFNLSISCLRAGLMLIIFYGGEVFYRKADTLNSLGLALTIILLFAPNACMDIGLLLSVCGTLGVGVFAPILIRHLKIKRAKPVVDLAICSSMAILCTLPLSAIYFGGTSLIGLVSNLLIHPLVLVLLIAMTVFSLSGGYIEIALLIAGLMAKCIKYIIDLLVKIPYIYLNLDYEFVLPWVVVSAAIIVLIKLLLKHNVRVVQATIASFCILAVMIISAERASLPTLTVTSDGQSGVVFLEDENGLTVITNSDSRSNLSSIRRYMMSNYVDEISLLILTNSTDNYTSGFEELPVETCLLPYDMCIQEINMNESLKAFINIDNVVIQYNGISILVGEMKSVDLPSADIMVLSGHKNQPLERQCKTMIYLHKQQAPQKQNERNAYFEKIVYSFVMDGENDS